MTEFNTSTLVVSDRLIVRYHNVHQGTNKALRHNNNNTSYYFHLKAPQRCTIQEKYAVKLLDISTLMIEGLHNNYALKCFCLKKLNCFCWVPSEF